MIHPKFSIPSARWTCALLAVLISLTACSPPPEVEQAVLSPARPQPSPTTAPDAFSYLPEAARAASHYGDPRPPAYWAVWNACAPENRAETARANGGRAAGWVLMDDLLADPGIRLGDFAVDTCAQGLALLQSHTLNGDAGGDPLYALAAALLAAELNLNAGAETCPAAEEAVVGGHLVLSHVGFNGAGEYSESTSEEIIHALPEFIELLSGYNRGELCR